MATEAQIAANLRNCQKSTGPRTETGKSKSKLNAVTHGRTARTIMPVLPQEYRKGLEDKTQQVLTARKPRDPLEHDTICRAVRLSWEIDRADRIATAHLSHQVRMAERLGPETVSACELKEIHELGSKLFFLAAIGPGYTETTADDYPALSLNCSVIKRHVGRLEDLLAEHEAIETEEEAERYDRAALDCSPAFERHRRYQSAKHRELMQTLEALRKMRNAECGSRNGGWQVSDGGWQMSDGG